MASGAVKIGDRELEAASGPRPDSDTADPGNPDRERAEVSHPGDPGTVQSRCDPRHRVLASAGLRADELVMILIAGLMICTTLSAIPRSFWWRGFACGVIKAPFGGVDGRSAWYIEPTASRGSGVAAVCVEGPQFPSSPVRERIIPKAGRQEASSGHRDHHRPGSPGVPETGAGAIFEADFPRAPTGSGRNGARGRDAEMHHLSGPMYEWVVEGDIKACLDPWSYCS